jgi:hypothetical protein
MDEKIISKKDLPEEYRFQASLTNHPIIRDEHGVIRYQRNPLVCWLQEHSDLNAMWIAYRRHHSWSTEAFMQFYRDIGYSLSGFEEVWGEELDKLEDE